MLADGVMRPSEMWPRFRDKYLQSASKLARGANLKTRQTAQSGEARKRISVFRGSAMLCRVGKSGKASRAAKRRTWQSLACGEEADLAKPCMRRGADLTRVVGLPEAIASGGQKIFRVARRRASEER